MERSCYFCLILVWLNFACDQAPKEKAIVKETAVVVKTSPGAPSYEVPEVMVHTATVEGMALSTALEKEPRRKNQSSNSYRFSNTDPLNYEAEKPNDSSPSPSPNIPAPEPEIVLTSLPDLYRYLEKPAQTFTFSGQKDTVLIGAEGTRVTIPANVLVSEKTGKPVRGVVQLRIREYYTIADMLTANLSTKSGKELLETGGMIQLEAFAGTEKLQLQPGTAVNLSFPTTDFKPGMQLFNGEWQNGQVNWHVEKKAGTKNDSYFLKGEKLKFKFTQPRYPEGEAAMHRYINKHFPFPEKRPKKKKRSVGIYRFVVLGDGTITDIVVAQKVNPVLDKAAVYMLSNMPKWTPGLEFNVPWPKTYTVAINYQEVKKPRSPKALAAALETEQRSQEIQLKYASKPDIAKFTKDLNKDGKVRNFEKLENVTASDIAFYTMSTTKLNWINCDRFVGENWVRFNYSPKIDPQEETDIKLVFHKYRSILSSFPMADRLLIYGVPENEKVTVIAMKKVDTRLFLAMQEMVTSASGLPELTYQEVTLETLKAEMKKLNNL